VKIKFLSRSAFLNAPVLLLFGLDVFLVSFALLMVDSNALAAAPTVTVRATPDIAFQALFESYGNDTRC
jgi:hypothetical protein